MDGPDVVFPTLPAAPQWPAAALFSVALILLAHAYVFRRAILAVLWSGTSAARAAAPAGAPEAGRSTVASGSQPAMGADGRPGLASQAVLPTLATATTCDGSVSSVTSDTSFGLTTDATRGLVPVTLAACATPTDFVDGADDFRLLHHLPEEDVPGSAAVATTPGKRGRFDRSGSLPGIAHESSTFDSEGLTSSVPSPGNPQLSVHASASTSALLGEPTAFTTAPTTAAGKHRASSSSLSAISPPTVPAPLPLEAHSNATHRLYPIDSGDGNSHATSDVAQVLLASAPCLDASEEGVSQELDRVLRTSAPASSLLAVNRASSIASADGVDATALTAGLVFSHEPRRSPSVPLPSPLQQQHQQQQQQRDAAVLHTANASSTSGSVTGAGTGGAVVSPAMLLGEFVASRWPVVQSGAAGHDDGADPRTSPPAATAGGGSGNGTTIKRALPDAAAATEQQQREVQDSAGNAKSLSASQRAAAAATAASIATAISGGNHNRVVGPTVAAPPQRCISADVVLESSCSMAVQTVDHLQPLLDTTGASLRGSPATTASGRAPGVARDIPATLPPLDADALPPSRSPLAAVQRAAPAAEASLGARQDAAPGVAGAAGGAAGGSVRAGGVVPGRQPPRRRGQPSLLPIPQYTPYKSSLRCPAVKVCIKLQTDQGLSAIPTDMALQLQSSLRNTAYLSNLDVVLDMAAREGCICVSLDLSKVPPTLGHLGQNLGRQYAGSSEEEESGAAAAVDQVLLLQALAPVLSRLLPSRTRDDGKNGSTVEAVGVAGSSGNGSGVKGLGMGKGRGAAGGGSGGEVELKHGFVGATLRASVHKPQRAGVAAGSGGSGSSGTSTSSSISSSSSAAMVWDEEQGCWVVEERHSSGSSGGAGMWPAAGELGDDGPAEEDVAEPLGAAAGTAAAGGAVSRSVLQALLCRAELGPAKQVDRPSPSPASAVHPQPAREGDGTIQGRAAAPAAEAWLQLWVWQPGSCATAAAAEEQEDGVVAAAISAVEGWRPPSQHAQHEPRRGGVPRLQVLCRYRGGYLPTDVRVVGSARAGFAALLEVHVTWPDEATLPRHHAGGPVLSLAPLQLELWMGATRCLSQSPALVLLRPHTTTSTASITSTAATAAQSSSSSSSSTTAAPHGGDKAPFWGLWARVSSPEPHGWWWGLGGPTLPSRRDLIGAEAAEQLRLASAELSDQVLAPLLQTPAARATDTTSVAPEAPVKVVEAEGREVVPAAVAEEDNVMVGEEEWSVSELMAGHAHFIQDLHLWLEQVAMRMRQGGVCESASPFAALAATSPPVTVAGTGTGSGIGAGAGAARGGSSLLPRLEATAPLLPRAALLQLAEDLMQHAVHAELPAVAAMVRAQMRALPAPPARTPTLPATATASATTSPTTKAASAAATGPAATAAATFPAASLAAGATAAAAAPPTTSWLAAVSSFGTALHESCFGNSCPACEAHYLSWLSQQLASVQLFSSGAFAIMGLAANWASLRSHEPWSNFLMLPWGVVNAVLFACQWRRRQAYRQAWAAAAAAANGAATANGEAPVVVTPPEPLTCCARLSVATFLLRWLVEVGMAVGVFPILDATVQQLRRGVDGVIATTLFSLVEQAQASSVLGARAALAAVLLEICFTRLLCLQCGCTWQVVPICAAALLPRLLQDMRMRALMRRSMRARGVRVGAHGAHAAGAEGGGAGSEGRWAAAATVETAGGGAVRQRRVVGESVGYGGQEEGAASAAASGGWGKVKEA